VGQYDQFTNNYVQISELGYSQSSVIAATATGQRESWIFQVPSFNIGDKVIYGVVMDTVAQTDVGGTITDFRPFLRINNTDFDSATNLGANNTAPDSYVTEFVTNPATTQPWLQADLTGLQAGIRSL
jgi:hypothetical protein